jgi:hypothetical protein
MPHRDFKIDYVPGNLIMRSGRNWTAVWFFAGLGALHLSIAIPAFMHGHWEGYLSLGFGIVFIGVSVVCWLARYELAILSDRRLVRVRTGYRRVSFEKEIPFTDVRAVRLTMTGGHDLTDSRIELLCDREDIECPPTPVPQEQALCLAITMGVELIKVLPLERDS